MRLDTLLPLCAIVALSLPASTRPAIDFTY